jgi:hypothetical protein
VLEQIGACLMNVVFGVFVFLYEEANTIDRKPKPGCLRLRTSPPHRITLHYTQVFWVVFLHLKIQV